MTPSKASGSQRGINFTIVSGGQTGVDRAALDVALALGIPACGWVPEGRKAEDGVIPDHYPVKELAGAGYRERTRQNVIDSDATLIIYFNELSGGTLETLQDCRQYQKDHCLIDASKVDLNGAVRMVLEFITNHAVGVLNVAGPRASGEQHAYEYAKHLLTNALSQVYSVLG